MSTGLYSPGQCLPPFVFTSNFSKLLNAIFNIGIPSTIVAQHRTVKESVHNITCRSNFREARTFALTSRSRIVARNNSRRDVVCFVISATPDFEATSLTRLRCHYCVRFGGKQLQIMRDLRHRKIREVGAVEGAVNTLKITSRHPNVLYYMQLIHEFIPLCKCLPF